MGFRWDKYEAWRKHPMLSDQLRVAGRSLRDHVDLKDHTDARWPGRQCDTKYCAQFLDSSGEQPHLRST